MDSHPPASRRAALPLDPRPWWASVWIVIGLFAAACLFYNLSYPVLEGSDEPFHYGYVEMLRSGQGLPDPARADDHLAQYESSQAPLYYLTAAAVLRLVPGVPEWDGAFRLNRWYGGQPVAFPDNKNLILHDFDDPAERFSGLARGVRVARLVSTIFGALAVLATYYLAREITADHPWLPLLAAALTTFNPMFVQVSSVVENDAAGAAFAGLFLWRLALIVRRRPGGWQPYALAGLFAGLAVLSKASALVVAPIAAIGLALAWWPDRARSSLWAWIGRGFIMALVALVAGGWWYAYNWLEYGDPLRNVAYDGSQYRWMKFPQPRTFAMLLPEMPRSLLSFWADLGYSGDIRPTPVFYAGAGLVTALALFGLIHYALARRSSGPSPLVEPPLAILLLASILLSLGMFLRLKQIFAFAWGRHLLPGVVAINVTLAIGLYHVWPRHRRRVARIAAAFFAAYAFIIPATILPWSYQPPRLTHPPDLRYPLGWQFGDTVRLIGYDTGSHLIEPGRDKVITLCWETLATPDVDYGFALHLVASSGEVVGARDSHHGLGRYPSSAWRPGDVFCDPVRVPVQSPLPLANLYWLRVAVYHPDTLEPLPVTVGGQPAPTFAGWLKLRREPISLPPEATIPARPARFGNLIALDAYQITDGSSPRITFYWRALNPIPGEYTLFVHAVDPIGQVAAQIDSQPWSGQYPTWAWDAGEIVSDSYTLPALPANGGPYQVLVGWYLLATVERLPVYDGDQMPPDRALRLVTLEIDAP